MHIPWHGVFRRIGYDGGMVMYGYSVTGDTMRNMMVLVVVFGIGGYTLYPVIMTAVMVIVRVVETLGG